MGGSHRALAGEDRMVGAIAMAAGLVIAGLIFAVDSYKKKKKSAVTPVQIPA